MRILVTTLNWGLGHAARSVPVIRLLQSKGVEVIIGADGGALALLKKEFPELENVKIPDIRINYPLNGNMVWYMFRQLPAMRRQIKSEHKYLQRVIREKGIHAVISDNRYGMWSESIPAAIIAHQVNIKSPVMADTVNKLNRKLIDRFRYCWIPDLPGENNLAGELSHGNNLPENSEFIGFLSRFNDPMNTQGEKGRVLILLSGPEPQRSALEEKLLDELIFPAEWQKGRQFHLVRGIAERTGSVEIHPKLKVTESLTSDELKEELDKAELVISRPGYSTLMDLKVMGKKSIFIPTPGQTEQEYLAVKMKGEKVAPFFTQDEFSFEVALEQLSDFTGFVHESFTQNLLQAALDRFLSEIK